MGNISKQKLVMTDSVRIFGGICFAHLSPEILTKHNINKIPSKVNTWGSFYIPKGEGLGGGQIIRKYYVMRKHLYKS